MKLDWDNAGITKTEVVEYAHTLEPVRAAMEQTFHYNNEYASINLPIDEEHLAEARATAKKHAKTQLLVIVGIGGSNLGTMAVQEAVQGPRRDVLYADTTDTDKISRIRMAVRKACERKEHVLLNVISKSGGTTETIANAEVLINEIKRNKQQPEDHVVFTTGIDSKLWHYAKQEGYDVLTIPENVGGRYSVFSLVGLFPLAVLGIDIDKLLQGAAHMRGRCLRKQDNPAIIRAGMLAKARKKGRNIADNFYFSTDLENVGKWYRQLMGESIGKEWDAERKKRVWMGITPTVSIGTTDLHSMAQLYYGGPADKTHTIVTVKKWKSSVTVPRWQRFDAIVPNIQGKNYATITESVVEAVTRVLREQRRPYCTITLPDTKEESIGALLQLHMMEMIYLGALLGVNPFDQPNVEAYKTETKRILARKS